MRVLSESGVDEKAQHELFLLAQLSPAGAVAANGIVADMWKKEFTGNLRKPSAFIQGSCADARRHIVGE